MGMRPEGWENQWDLDEWEIDLSTLMCSQKTIGGTRVIDNQLREQLRLEREAGADAMLEGLMKNECNLKMIGGRTFELDFPPNCKFGHLVFIPEEEE